MSASQLISGSVCDVDGVFGDSINQLANLLKTLAGPEMVVELAGWLRGCYSNNREGFLAEMVADMEDNCAPKEIMKLTKYSYSTLERYFKKETGLTPKKYQRVQRCKLAIEEIYDTKNSDWQYYIDKYEYYDQSHFIKEIKSFSSYTPAQMLSIPGLRSYRPL